MRAGLSCRASHPCPTRAPEGSDGPRNRRPPLRPALRTAILLGVLSALIPVPAWCQIGIFGGYARDSFDGYVGEEFRLADRTDGFHTGIFLSFDIGRLGIRPGIAYHQLGGAVIPAGDEPVPVDVELIELQLDGRLSAPLPLLKPYIVGGAMLMFPSSARSTIDARLAGSVWRMDVGVGFEWDVGFRILPEIRYGRSIGGLVAYDPSGASSFDTFTARLSISF